MTMERVTHFSLLVHVCPLNSSGQTRLFNPLTAASPTEQITVIWFPVEHH